MPDIDQTTIVKVLTPKRRALRETLQFAFALVAAVPVLVGMLLDDASAQEVLAVVGPYVGVAKLLITYVMNFVDALGGTDTPTLGVTVTPPTVARG